MFNTTLHSYSIKIIITYFCKHEQPVRDFLSEIRIESYKLLKDEDARMERSASLTFTKGLYNKEMRLALTQKDVSTLDEAYRLVKRKRY